MITHKVIVQDLVLRLHKLKITVSANEQVKLASFCEDLTQIARDLKPDSFRDLNRQKYDESKEEKYWTGWFLGDGDGASKYFKYLASLGAQEEADKLKELSREMREWGREIRDNERQYLQN